MSWQFAQDHFVHHAANAAAVTIPIMSAMLDAPTLLTEITGVLGILWYAVLFGEKIWVAIKKFRRYKGR